MALRWAGPRSTASDGSEPPDPGSTVSAPNWGTRSAWAGWASAIAGTSDSVSMARRRARRGVRLVVRGITRHDRPAARLVAVARLSPWRRALAASLARHRRGGAWIQQPPWA